MAKEQSLSGQDQNATLITDLPAPSAPTDAARKSYVDDADALRVKRIEPIPFVSSGSPGRQVTCVLAASWGASSMTGDIVIETPIPFLNFMTQLRIQGLTYQALGDIDLTITFYAYSVGPAFVNVEAVNNGSAPISSVKVMRKTSDNTVAIVITSGAASNFWHYPKITIDTLVGYNTPSDALFTGWSAIITTDLSAYSAPTTAVTPSAISRVGHTHTKANITDLGTIGTAAAKNVPSSGNATGTDVVLASDTRLADARTPTTAYQNAAKAEFARDPQPVLTATGMTAYGDSFAAEYGLAANTGFISQAASALGMTTPMVNRGASGSSGRSVGHLALGVAALGFRWAASSSGAVIVHAGLNDAREFDLTNAANAKYIRAYKNSLRILATLVRGQERVAWSDASWTFTGTWTTGAYNFTSTGTLKASTVADSTAIIAFTGSEISVILGHAIGSTADAEILIDGVTVRNVHLEQEATNGSGEGLSVGWAAQRFTGLGAGKHTMTIRRSGGTGGLCVDSYVLPADATPQLKFVEAAYMDPTQYSLYSPFNNGSNASVDQTRNAMRDVAAEFNHVTVVPAVTLTAVTDYQADKVHPNASGTTKLTNALQASLSTRPDLEARVANVLASRVAQEVLAAHFASKQQIDDGALNRLSIKSTSLLNLASPVINANFGSVEIFQLGVNIGSMTVENGRDGQDLRIMHYRSAAETIVWPSNFRWANNAAPAAPTAGTRNYYTMNYSSETGLYYECAARVLGVPYF